MIAMTVTGRPGHCRTGASARASACAYSVHVKVLSTGVATAVTIKQVYELLKTTKRPNRNH